MKVRFSLRNDFHKTTTTVITEDGFVTASQAKAVGKRLCGVEGCTCADTSIGTRGFVNPSVIPHPNGGATFVLFA